MRSRHKYVFTVLVVVGADFHNCLGQEILAFPVFCLLRLNLPAHERGERSAEKGPRGVDTPLTAGSPGPL